MKNQSGRTSEPSRVARRPPPTVPPDNLCDGDLAYRGLIHAIYVVGEDGEASYTTTTDCHRLDAMLYAAEEGLEIGDSLDRYLHLGTRTPPCEAATAAVSHLVDKLRRQGVLFFVLWHLQGAPQVHLDRSEGMKVKKVRRHLERLAREEALEVALAQAAC
jgi:hypothetical protein